MNVRRRCARASVMACGIWWVISLETACPAPPTAVQQRGRDNRMDPNDNLMAELLRVRNGEFSLAEARSVVQRASALKNPTYAPVLTDIVRQAAPTNRHLVAFDALHALWLLGEGATFFVDLANAHASDKMAAYYAILILARQPDLQILSLLQRVQQSSEDNQIRGAVDLAKFVAYNEQQLRAIPDAVLQADFLIEKLHMGWNPIQVEEHSPTGNLSPVAVWSQSRLRALSEQHPGEVALAISKIGPSSSVGPEWPKFKAYVSRFINQDPNSGVPAIPR
jgi:hypothetical protein